MIASVYAQGERIETINIKAPPTSNAVKVPEGMTHVRADGDSIYFTKS